MNSILNNPFRTLGLLNSASYRDIIARVNKLLIYAELNRELPDDEDFCFRELMGNVQRSKDNVLQAKAELDFDRDKHALMWFRNSDSQTDTSAFSALRDNKPLTALNIWHDTIAQQSDNTRNTALLNFSTLALILGATRQKPDWQLIKNGLEVKLLFFENNSPQLFDIIIGNGNCQPDDLNLESWLLDDLEYCLRTTTTDKSFHYQRLMLYKTILELPPFKAKEKRLFISDNQAVELYNAVIDEINVQRKCLSDSCNEAIAAFNARMLDLQKQEQEAIDTKNQALNDYNTNNLNALDNAINALNVLSNLAVSDDFRNDTLLPNLNILQHNKTHFSPS